MNTHTPPGSSVQQHFLQHQTGWSVSLLLLWAVANTLLLSTTELMEARRADYPLLWWEPWCWEISSIVIVLLLVWPLAQWLSWLKGRFSLAALIFIHVLATLPFSVFHVSAMVALRKLWYSLVGSSYHFGEWGYGFLYEYRKDAMTYFILVAVISCYRFIVLRLQGEARYIDESATSAKPLPDRLLIKKLGKEFLIAVGDVAWVEASGNYANLHIGISVYPMRITMKTLEARLPAEFCRVHRSVIVNIHYIDHIQPLDSGDAEIRMRSGHTVSLSRRYRESCRALLKQWELAS